jgi:hypothetical protein
MSCSFRTSDAFRSAATRGRRGMCCFVCSHWRWQKCTYLYRRLACEVGVRVCACAVSKSCSDAFILTTGRVPGVVGRSADFAYAEDEIVTREEHRVCL